MYQLRGRSSHTPGVMRAGAAALFLLIAATAWAVPPTGNSRFVYGDMNGDGAITISDAALALQEVVDGQATDLRGDVVPVHSDGSRGDDQVAIGDVISILRTAVGLEPAHAAQMSLVASAGPAIAAIVPPSIPLHLTVAAAGTDAVRLEYLTGSRYDFAIYQGYNEIWRWSRHAPSATTSAVVGAPGDLVVVPGTPQVLDAVWDGRDDNGQAVPPGQYQLRGELPTANGGLLGSELAPLSTGGGSGGLTVTLTTDRTTYNGFTQPVRMTLTETNTGTQDVKVYIGCPTFYDFWVDLGNKEVWRWSHGRVECLAIGTTVLHPGDSRQFTVEWDGSFNESPPLPLPSRVNYQVNGQIQEPDGVHTPAPVTITVGVFPADYFPMAAGSVWTYSHHNFGDTNPDVAKQTITGTQTANGETYFVFDRYSDDPNVPLREDGAGVVWQATPSGETPRYKLNAAEGEQWQFQPDPATRAYTGTMVSRSADLDTPYGHLTNLLAIAFLTGVDTSETDYLAPGIGLVGVDHRVNVLDTPSLRLSDYQPGPTVTPFDFPLAVGDTWSYINADPRLASPTAPVITQSIVDSVTAGGQTYFVFDRYSGDANVGLRLGSGDVVLQQSPSGETERYRLDAAVGDTWTFSPSGSGGWRAHMDARDATLDTPYGTLTGLLKITFSGIDSGWSDYLKSGIGLVGRDNFVMPTGAFANLRLKSFDFGAQKSGIEGVAMAGPTQPVCRVDQPCEKPLPGAVITVQPAGGGPEIARAVADAQGQFRIPLHPGTYLVVPLPPQPGPLPRGASQTVTVPAGQFVNITVEYDTGIR